MNLNDDNYKDLTVNNLRKITGKPSKNDWLQDSEITKICNELQICVKTIIDLQNDTLNATVEPSNFFRAMLNSNYCLGKLIHIINLNRAIPLDPSINLNSITNLAGNHFDLLLPPQAATRTKTPQRSRSAPGPESAHLTETPKRSITAGTKLVL